MPNKEQQNFTETIDLIDETLQKAAKLGLESEVITSTILHLQSNPLVGLKEALEYGLKEWDI
jgi:hypothetical protein